MWKVQEDNVTMFNPNSCTCFVPFNVMNEPCPSKINKWQLHCEMPLGTYLDWKMVGMF
jgi:hypothetical protein